MSMTICDRADEFRIEINGHFAGKGVNDVRSVWEEALLENAPRRFTVDITQLGGYDYAGCQLLRDMYRHGTRIAARTALSLAFLKEILRSSNSGRSSRFQAASEMLNGMEEVAN